jgi:signal transduction histidine kinase
MGLGLAMVKSILENINSTISFTSIENEGTVFELRFPLQQKNEL